LFLLQHETRFALDQTGDSSCQACQQPRQDELDAHVMFRDVDRPADALRQCAEAELEAIPRPSLIVDPEQRREVPRKLREAFPQAAGSFLLTETMGDGDDQGFRHGATLLPCAERASAVIESHLSSPCRERNRPLNAIGVSPTAARAVPGRPY